MLKIRRPVGRLIFNMGIAIPSKTVFLIETAPWLLVSPGKCMIENKNMSFSCIKFSETTFKYLGKLCPWKYLYLPCWIIISSPMVLRGYTGFTLSVCPSVCRWNHVCSVISTMLAGSISYLHSLSTNFRMCWIIIPSPTVLKGYIGFTLSVRL